jgi:uncharacterized protein YycO
MRYFYFFVLIFVAGISVSCKQKQEVAVENIAFQEGDLVFRRGVGVRSRAVLYSDSQGIYSHTGIVVLKDSTFQVVHITPGERENDENADIIKIEPISDFWRHDRASHGAVYRLKDSTLCEKAAQQALRLLQKGVLFDHDYQLDDTTKMYCTELVWYAYAQAGKDISYEKRSVMNVPLYAGSYIFPSDIYSNSDFILVYSF